MNAEPTLKHEEPGIKERLSGLVDTTKLYVENRLELAILKGTSKISKSIATVAVLGIAFIMSSLALVFLFFGLAIVINEKMDSQYAGHFIMAGVLVLLVALVITAGKQLVKNVITNIILENIDDDD